MAFFVEGLKTLENMGITDLFLPFLLIFTIIFAVLQKSGVLGKDKKNFNLVIALVIALSVVIPHVTDSYPPGADVVDIMNKALPNVSIVIVAIIMLLIMVGVLGGEAKWMGGSLSGWIAIISVLIIIYIFGRAAGWFNYLPAWLRWLDDREVWSVIVILLIFGIVIWFITKEPSANDEIKFVKSLGDFFKGGK